MGRLWQTSSHPVEEAAFEVEVEVIGSLAALELSIQKTDHTIKEVIRGIARASSMSVTTDLVR